jgi:hypothetical protein
MGFVLVGVFKAHSQKGLNSIYSAYGIGDYRMRDANAYSGMGNVGVAMPSQFSINEINPASFGWLNKDRFTFEAGFSGLSTNYTNEKVNISAGDFSISRMALGMQLINPLRTVVGLRRFSQVDYYTTATRDIAGTNQQLLSEVEGNGGLYQVYMGNAFTIKNKLSLGVTTGFVFGSINSKETMTLSETDILIAESNKFYTHGSVNAGLQYQFKTGKNKWMLGAFYEPQIKLNVQEDNQLKNGSDEILSSKAAVNSKFVFPSKYGFGATWTKSSFTASADIIRHMWSSTGYKGADFTTTDATSYAIGIRHQFIRNSIWGISPGISIYAGFNKEDSYIVIKDNQLKSTSATLGITIPNRNNLNYYSLGLKVGTRGQPVYPMIKENFFEFHINMAFSSYFSKGKKFD